MTDTSPAALRALADLVEHLLDSVDQAIIVKDEVTDCNMVSDTLRALAAEKEAGACERASGRLQALEEAAVLADTYDDWCDSWGNYTNLAAAQTAAVEIAKAIRVAAEKEAGAPVDWPAEANEAAQRVLTSLGYLVSPSLEPGADHRRDRIAVIIDQYARSIAAQKTAPAPDGWIPWEGGECPVPAGTLVDVQYRDGARSYREVAQRLSHGFRNAGPALWRHGGNGNDIIAYRPHKEPFK